MPTLLQAAGTRVDASAFDGLPLLDVLAGDAPAPARVLELGGGAAVTARWKLIRGALYDLSRDPDEREDVASRNPSIVAQLRSRIGAR